MERVQSSTALTEDLQWWHGADSRLHTYVRQCINRTCRGDMTGLTLFPLVAWSLAVMLIRWDLVVGLWG